MYPGYGLRVTSRLPLCHGFITSLSRYLSSAVAKMGTVRKEVFSCLAVLDKQAAAFLNLKELTPDRTAARLLPLPVAKRCRALPIAQDNGCITVAMADPADHAARADVTAALLEGAAGRPGAVRQVYLVQGDPALIDRWLADLSLVDAEQTPVQPAAQPIEVWLREPLHGDKNAITRYAAQMAALLTAPLGRLDPLAVHGDWPNVTGQATHRLLILPCLGHNRSAARQEPGNPVCTVYACRPRWPLRRLLLIVRGDPVDDAALTWAARLARASGAATTALMVAPHASNSQALPAHDDISSLLSAHIAAGSTMQRTAQRLTAHQVDAVFHLRQGAPELVIREELASLSYDLVIASVAVANPDAPWRLRPLLHKLLPDLKCPLLLTAGQTLVE